MFNIEKLEECSYPTVTVKKFEDMFIHFDRIHERDRHPDRQTETARRYRPRLCIASREKGTEKPDGIHPVHNP